MGVVSWEEGLLAVEVDRALVDKAVDQTLHGDVAGALIVLNVACT